MSIQDRCADCGWAAPPLMMFKHRGAWMNSDRVWYCWNCKYLRMMEGIVWHRAFPCPDCESFRMQCDCRKKGQFAAEGVRGGLWTPERRKRMADARVRAAQKRRQEMNDALLR